MFNFAYKILAQRLGLLFLFYLGLRLAFYLFNLPVFASVPFLQLVIAFVHGLRFDLSALTLINMPFVVLSLLPKEKVFRTPTYQRWLLVVYAVLNVPFFFVNLVDIEYYKFVGRRTTNELFTITGDLMDQGGHLARDYWFFLVIEIILAFLLVRLYPRYGKTVFTPRFPLSLRILAFLLLVPVMVVAIRGGFQYKPLRSSHAFIQEPAEVGNIALNSSFTFIRSVNNRPFERENYFPDQQAAARQVGFSPYAAQQQPGAPLRDNVVVLILESFGTEYVGAENKGVGYTPFLDSLAAAGTLFRENYANGKQSIVAIPSILAGLPALMDDPFIASSFESNQVFGLGSVLKPAGYETSFFHGGINGTMGFNNFARLIGMDKYFGLNEYPLSRKEKDFDGLWGIYDEPYLQYFISQLNRHREPFATSVFTLSSHDPYTIPAAHVGRFPKGKLKLHETLGYTDHALRQFFKVASRQPWYARTLFILTGDHTQKTVRPGYNNKVAMHKVPLILFHPGKSFDFADTTRITQHADILPTVVDYLNIKTDKLLPFGQSVLDTTNRGRALYYQGGIFTLVHHDYITELWPDGKLKMYGYKTHGFRKLQKPVAAKLAVYGPELKAFVQYFRNGLIDNNLYYWIKNNRPGGASR
jgi:phosphoglycerol transferase MdoB-like AlkP superfamily enzyme